MPALLERVKYEPTRLVIPARLSWDDWTALLASLGAMAHAHQWWIGDALVHGEQRFGEEFAAGADELGLAAHTMVNYRWVASAVEAPRRRVDLLWSHHAEVARLEPDEQAAMLERAAEKGMTVRELRLAVAAAFPRENGRAAKVDSDADPYEQATAEARLWQALHDLAQAWERLSRGGIVAKDEQALANMVEKAERADEALRGG